MTIARQLEQYLCIQFERPRACTLVTRRDDSAREIGTKTRANVQSKVEEQLGSRGTTLRSDAVHWTIIVSNFGSTTSERTTGTR